MVEKYIFQTEEEKKELTILEKYNYEFQANMSIIKIALEQNIMSLNPEAYQNCIENYIKSFSNFEAQKKIFENKIIKPIAKKDKFTWFISFIDESVEITYDE